MNRIALFLHLECYTLKPYKQSYLLLVVLITVMTLAFQSLTALCSYIMMCLILVSSYPFSITDKNGLDTLYATLSLHRRDVVTGRYIFALCSEAACFLLALILSLSFSAVTGMPFVLHEILLYLCIGSFFYALVIGVQFPLFFKLGYDKAKYIAYTPLVLVSVGIILLPRLMAHAGLERNFADIWRLIPAYSKMMYGLPFFAGLLLLAVSHAVSCRLYAGRDM